MSGEQRDLILLFFPLDDEISGNGFVPIHSRLPQALEQNLKVEHYWGEPTQNIVEACDSRSDDSLGQRRVVYHW